MVDMIYMVFFIHLHLVILTSIINWFLLLFLIISHLYVHSTHCDVRGKFSRKLSTWMKSLKRKKFFIVWMMAIWAIFYNSPFLMAMKISFCFSMILFLLYVLVLFILPLLKPWKQPKKLSQSPMAPILNWMSILLVIVQLLFFILIPIFYYKVMVPNIHQEIREIPLTYYFIVRSYSIFSLPAILLVNWYHHKLMKNDLKVNLLIPLTTVSLSLAFTKQQEEMFIYLFMIISKGDYSTTLLVIRSFYAIHFLMGAIFIMVSVKWILSARLTADINYDFKVAAWYLHSMDMLWLFLFISAVWQVDPLILLYS